MLFILLRSPFMLHRGACETHIVGYLALLCCCNQPLLRLYSPMVTSHFWKEETPEQEKHVWGA
jgi:hypothetical protein